MGKRGLGFWIGIGLVCVSAYFSVNVLIQFGATPVERFFYALMGIFSQIAVTYFFLTAYEQYFAKNPICYAFGFAYVLGAFISVNFTVSNMAVTDEVKSSEMSKANIAYNLKMENIATLRDQEQILSSVSKEYKDMNRFKYGVFPTNDKITNIIEQKELIASEIQSIPIEKNSHDAMFKRMAYVFSTGVDSMKTLIFLILAIALEIFGPASMAADLMRKQGFQQDIIIKTVGTPAGNGHKKQIADSKPPEPKQAQKPLGLQMGSGISDDIEKYIDAAYIGDGVPMQGIGKTAALTGLPQRRISDAIAELKRLGLVAKEGNKTVPQVNKQQMLQEIRI